MNSAISSLVFLPLWYYQSLNLVVMGGSGSIYIYIYINGKTETGIVVLEISEWFVFELKALWYNLTLVPLFPLNGFSSASDQRKSCSPVEPC